MSSTLAVLAMLLLGWIVWPLLLTRLLPADGPSWIVVLDGYHRLDLAFARQYLSGEPILLITCPATGQPSAVQRQSASALLLVLSEGFDTVTQVVALASWLGNRRADGIPPPLQIVLVSDAHHLLSVVHLPAAINEWIARCRQALATAAPDGIDWLYAP